ncbi:hypothetical protein O181_106276 [Austropuccinia psidii MF-1]|uniref:Integrase catalytic domain-containing protein n=1 Tax=Austropuccinia psidii MF-1 TaxID=1389203 RepID=A0A9Q3JR52_9BASI|nr:hypothetical protein [Austropuccinia psidii MF-1]
MLKLESDDFELFIIVNNYMANHHDQNLKALVLDKGGEFVNSIFKELSENNGIIHILSLTETPQHNRFSGRANCKVIEKARWFLSNSHLPKRYLEEAVNTATFF